MPKATLDIQRDRKEELQMSNSEDKLDKEDRKKHHLLRDRHMIDTAWQITLENASTAEGLTGCYFSSVSFQTKRSIWE